MTQMMIELNDDVLRKIQAGASRENLPPNRWLSRVVCLMFQDDKQVQLEAIRDDAIARGWPEELIDAAGTWTDFPTLEEIRSGMGEDAPREVW